jgi:hypothetical protein
MQETTQNTCKMHKFLSYLNFDLLNLLHYRMIKLICNRVTLLVVATEQINSLIETDTSRYTPA